MISANIRGDVFLEKLGEGTLILTGSNDHAGTIITNGELQVFADENLGSASSGVSLIIHYTGNLQYGASFDSARNIELIGGPSFELSGINTNGFNFTLSGQISGIGGIFKYGEGTLTLTNANNNFELGAWVDSGVLQQGAEGAFNPNAAYGANTGATLDLNHFDLTVSYLFGESGGVIDLGSATLTVASPTELQYQFNTLNSLFDGEITGSGSLVKEGMAILRLNSANTYSGGTTIRKASCKPPTSPPLALAKSTSTMKVCCNPFPYSRSANSTGTTATYACHLVPPYSTSKGILPTDWLAASSFSTGIRPFLCNQAIPCSPMVGSPISPPPISLVIPALTSHM